jgi:hypothetical protein
MATTIIVQDTRSKDAGEASSFGQESNVMKFWVNESTPLSALVTKVLRYSYGQPIKVLRLYGHGRTRGGVGYGMQLGQEGLDFTTMNAFGALNGKFDSEEGRVELRSCKVARGAEIGSSSSTMLLKSLANLCFATVYAADENQWIKSGVYWNGTVWMFPPLVDLE